MKNLENLKKAAVLLEDEEECERISALDRLSERSFFPLTIWGHFSSGKSRLINNLLGRSLLPTGSKETTAFLTFIMYGDQDQCRIIGKDGSVQLYETEKICEMSQDNCSSELLESIDHIEVELNHDLLRNGVAIVDTPGANTLIKQHQNLAYKAMDEAGHIIYVLGGALTDVDRDFIRDINRYGIGITFVRTRCDEIDENEENSEESLLAQKNELEQIVGREITYYAVSNLREDARFNNIEAIKERIKDISEHTKAEEEQTERVRWEAIAKNLVSKLKEELNRLEQAKDGNTQRLKAEEEKLSKDIEILQEEMDACEKQVSLRTEQAGIAVRSEVKHFIDAEVERFEQFLPEALKEEKDPEEEARHAFEQFAPGAVGGIRKKYESAYSEVIKEEDINFQNILGIRDQMVEESPTYEEIAEVNSAQIEQYRELMRGTSLRIEELEKERSEVIREINEGDLSNEEKVREIDAEIEQLDQAFRDLPADIPMRLIEAEGMQPSEKLRKLGEMADMALLLIPGDAIVAGIKGAANATKIAQILSKSGKIGKIILDSAKVAGKSANAIDRVRDVAYLANAVSKKRGYATKKQKEQTQKLIDTLAEKAGQAFDDYKEKKEEGSVLDVLSIAYWTEKIGKNFDTPPRYEIDFEQKSAMDQLRQDITEKLKKNNETKLRLLRESGLLKTKEDELKYMQKNQEDMLKEIEREFNSQVAEEKEKTRIRAIERFITSYTKHYKDYLHKCFQMMEEEYQKAAGRNITMYAAMKNSKRAEELSKKKEHLQSLICENKNTGDELECKCEQIRVLIDELEESV